MNTQKLKKPGVWIPIVVIVLAALAIALYLFQPWKLFVDQTVDEGVPTSQTSASASANPSANPTATAAPSAPTIQTLAQGSFVDQEHATSGTAKIIEVDGKRTLRLENLDTSNGPDLKVWLSDSPIEPGQAGWFNYNDGQYLDLGALKGNKGNQNYTIPSSAKLDRYQTAVIWCDRFSVAFGAAPLTQN